jgi:hypothetical protein
MCILPVFTYGSACWTLTDHHARRLQTEQRAMERIILKVSKRDHIRNETNRKKSKIKDVITHEMEQKWRWAGNVARFDDNRWSKISEGWEPKSKRHRGRPAKRWKDDIVEVGSIFWRKKAQRRENWKNMETAFIQRWIA